MIINSLREKRSGAFKFFVSRPYITLFIFILLSSVLLYWQFIFGDKVFVFNDGAVDTIKAYTKIYEFFSTSIKNGELTSYTFQNGFGNSTLSISTYLSDPFGLIGVLVGSIFGAEYIADSLIYILILKHICAGLLCLYFLKNFNFSTYSSAISAYLYAFCGYIALIGEHYFFSVKPIYLILILIVLEKVLQGEYKVKYWLGLLLTCALITLGDDPTGVYEILLTAGFYALFRAIFIYGKDFKNIFQRLGISLILVLGGMGISSFSFLPVMEKITGSSRINMENSVFSLNDEATIRTGVLRLFSNYLDGIINQYFGKWYDTAPEFPYFFSVLIVPIIVQFVIMTYKENFSKKEKFFRMAPVILLIFTILDKFVRLMYSFFVTHYDSFAYIFYPFFAFALADVLDRIKRGKFSRAANYLTMFISFLFIMHGGITTYNKGCHSALIIAVLSAVMLIVGCFAMDILYLSSIRKFDSQSQKHIWEMSSVALSAILILNSFSENYIMFNYERGILDRSTAHEPLLTTDIVNNVNTYEKDNFFRFETNYNEGRMRGNCYPYIFPIRATSYFDTSIDNGVPDFYRKMVSFTGNVYEINYQSACKKVDNTIVEDVLGVKYLLLTSDLLRSGWEKTAEYPDQGVALYQNTGIDSAGLLFDSYVTREEADKMSFNDRAIGMAERLIVNAPPQNIDDYAFKYSEKKEFDPSTYSDNSAFYINAEMPYKANINSRNFSDNKYYISADFEAEDSNVTIPLNTEIINDSRKATQVTFRLKNRDAVKNFAYFDSDKIWKLIPKFDSEIDGEETVYTFVMPQTASDLALCVNQPCTLDFLVSSRTYYLDNLAFYINSEMTYNSNINSRNFSDNQYYISADFTAEAANVTIPLNTEIINDSKKATQITFRLKNSNAVINFAYFDSDKIWKTIPEFEPEIDGEEMAYTFILPQTALDLALRVSQPCSLEFSISSKTVTASYVNEGIHLDNPGRGNVLIGTVETEKNSLLYLPIPYNKDWNAYIDGERVEILEANYAFMAVPISAGEHRVDFIYSNKPFHIGLILSLSTCVILLGFFTIYYIIGKRKKNTSERENKANDNV